MGITTRAAIAVAANESLVIDEVQLRSPEPGEVLVQMKASGLCHSDLSVMEGKLQIKLPMILGHEGAGIVVECGEGVTELRPGDHVILNNTAHCGHCKPCLSARTSYCMDMVGDQTRVSPFTWRGAPLPTFFQSASFAAHVVIDAGRVSIIPSSVAFDAASLVPCGVMTGVGAALNVAKVEAESQVIVVGMGSIGLNAIQGARIAKARTIIAIDTNPAKEAVARLFGATHFINPSTSDMPLHKQIYAIAGGKVDYAFDCVGHPKLLEQVMSLVDPYWGVVVAVGIAPFDQQITLPATTFYNGRALLGTYMGDFNPKTDTSRLVGLYQSGELLLDKLITHRLPLEEINEGFAMMKSGQSIRSVIIY